MGLFIRMLLYLLFGAIAGFGLGTFDGEAGTMTINVDSLAAVLTGIVGYVGTFVVGRVGAALRGWRT